MGLMKLNNESKSINKGKYKVDTNICDPRGRHCVVYDSERNLIVSRVWSESDCIKLSIMFNDNIHTPNYYSEYINCDVDKYIKKGK